MDQRQIGQAEIRQHSEPLPIKADIISAIIAAKHMIKLIVTDCVSQQPAINALYLRK